ncbi:MAG TPA: TetR/AcrR family transcriptional regulator [Steroidobacteraceae bacterium]|jgi:AcrR family transcriptional regulator|nr:TetR/AcrR family transcriptional regulator [Steroidobacteraceae bacterium]
MRLVPKSAAAARRIDGTAKGRREQLLDQAARELNSKGISMTSLTDVADKLGFSRASLYYYVEDREDLMFQVYLRSSEIMARRLGESAQPGSGALRVLGNFIAATLDPSEPELAALSEIGLLDQAERETVLGVFEAVVARLAGLLEAGAKAGHVRNCDFEIAARTIISIIHSIPLNSALALALHVSRHEIIAAAQDILASGWGADRTRAVNPAPIDFSPLLTQPGGLFDRGAQFEAKREKILAAASQLFNRRGVDTTSLEDIAAAVGATKRTLYHYVGDKQTILSACYARTDRIFSFIREQAAAQGGPATETLIAVLRANAISHQRDDIEPLRSSTGYDSLSDAEKLRATERGRVLVQAYRALCREAHNEHSMRDVNRDCLLLFMRGAGSWLAKGLLRGDDARKAQIAAEIADLLRLGLRPI